jgi:hypothetical protein
MAPNQKSLFFKTGPPIVAPISLRVKVGTLFSKWVSPVSVLLVK